jgi:hypothetical protein
MIIKTYNKNKATELNLNKRLQWIEKKLLILQKDFYYFIWEQSK